MEEKKEEISIRKVKLFFWKIYARFCLWIYLHSQCIRDYGWLDQETHFTKRLKERDDTSK